MPVAPRRVFRCSRELAKMARELDDWPCCPLRLWAELYMAQLDAEETLYLSGDNLTPILGIVKRSNLKKGGGKKICRQEPWKLELKR